VELVVTSARVAAASLVALALALASSPARAVEQQQHLALAPQLGILAVKDKSTASVGGGAAVYYQYGLTDQWNLSIEGSFSVVAANQKQDFPDAPKNRPAGIDQFSLGATYVIDILRWVPYIGLEGGIYRLWGGTLENNVLSAGAAISGGLNYQLTRHLAVGVGARQHFLLSNLSTYPSYTTVLLCFEYMWGY
jgi:hypothetical protein